VGLAFEANKEVRSSRRGPYTISLDHTLRNRLNKWLKKKWIDQYSAKEYRITTEPLA